MTCCLVRMKCLFLKWCGLPLFTIFLFPQISSPRAACNKLYSSCGHHYVGYAMELVPLVPSWTISYILVNIAVRVFERFSVSVRRLHIKVPQIPCVYLNLNSTVHEVAPRSNSILVWRSLIHIQAKHLKKMGLPNAKGKISKCYFHLFPSILTHKPLHSNSKSSKSLLPVRKY